MTRTKENCEWRINSRRSMTESRFYVDWCSDMRWGRLELVADNLTEAEAARMVAEHNANLEAIG